MAVAVSKALEDGARAVVCASTGNTAASAAAYAARAGLDGRHRARGRRRRPARSSPRRARPARAGRVERHASTTRSRQRRSSPSETGAVARQLAEPGSDRGAEDRSVRDRRGARRRARRARAPVRRRRQHGGVREGLRGSPTGRRPGSSSARQPTVPRRTPPRSGSPSPVHRAEVDERARPLRRRHRLGHR